ncbi:OLC1v1032212C1 [Oldenlandia corymbosa var. corymbosa]|uniref:OLC1v1032212C1 n=1 Tax=Oldenlandia corymbosa var. corymbosa TaxID=529605 RepID=A0AAV1CNM6_OLDCO|nr:OLC1v1032212C1 [Oldenlandia corymbosa var. corymbosa]
MYVARARSEYIKNPEALSELPDGPNSGYLVIQDGEDSSETSCSGLCLNLRLKSLPFPQNIKLGLRSDLLITCDIPQSSLENIILIPVLNLPLSSKTYYAVIPNGEYQGQAFTCSRESDMTTCCFWRCFNGSPPKPFDPRNIYQQFQVYEASKFSYNCYFRARSVAPDGIIPYFMQRGGWDIWTGFPLEYKLDESASGLNASLRARRPDFNFRPSNRTSKAVVVGKWYSPFMFVKDGKVSDQVNRSRYYQVTLEQKWEQIISSRNHHREGKSVSVDVILDRETVYVAGNRADNWDEGNAVEGAILLRSFGKAEEGREATVVGLSVELVQRIKWEQERGGWEGGKERQVKVERTEEFEGDGDWNEFGCFVLVESFVIRRMDGTVVMTWDFRHTQHIQSIWE